MPFSESCNLCTQRTPLPKNLLPSLRYLSPSPYGIFIQYLPSGPSHRPFGDIVASTSPHYPPTISFRHLPLTVPLWNLYPDLPSGISLRPSYGNLHPDLPSGTSHRPSYGNLHPNLPSGTFYRPLMESLSNTFPQVPLTVPFMGTFIQIFLQVLLTVPTGGIYAIRRQ